MADDDTNNQQQQGEEQHQREEQEEQQQQGEEQQQEPEEQQQQQEEQQQQPTTNGHNRTSNGERGSKSSSTSSSGTKDIYYFGYGPIVNDLVRRRRGIEVTEVQPAYLPDYRLTFAIGGNANIVHKLGFEVHGLLMKVKSKEDWEKLRTFEAGNTPTKRWVVPYSAMEQQQKQQTDATDDEDSHNADDDFNATFINGAIQAYLIEMPENVDDTLLDAPIERLPQERYLKLIAQGMRKYKVDEDYITDHIEACPFIPNRKPEEYYKFPVAKRVPKISFAKYLKMCERGNVEGDLYFCLGDQVFRMGEHDPANPLAKWFEAHGHGKADCTYMVHLTVVDPTIPFLDDPSEVTPLHIRWAENHLCEVVEQYGMSATRVYQLVGKTEIEEVPASSKLCCRSKEDPTEGPDCMDGSHRQLSCCYRLVRIFRRKKRYESSRMSTATAVP